MDIIKNELLVTKAFNRFSSVVVIGWFATGVILFGIFLDVESNEQSSFQCKGGNKEEKDIIRGRCFNHYKTEYTKGLPLYGFVILEFFVIEVVCVIYSQYAKPLIQELENEDVEIQRDHSQSTGLFRAYCCQLATRLTLVIVFFILMVCQVFYPWPVGFPLKYHCVLTHPLHQSNSSTSWKITETSYECLNLQADRKTTLTVSLYVANGILCVLILTEFIYIVFKARKVYFRKDSAFLESYLLSQNNKIGCMPLAETKEYIKKETEDYEPIIPYKPGEEKKRLKLDDMYTSLIIFYGTARHQFTGNRQEIIESGYLNTQENHKPIDKLKDLFTPNQDNSTVPHNILIIGRPGIGKTVLCQKILRDWAFGKLFSGETETINRFEFVYLIRFRDLGSDEQLNTQQWLDKDQYHRDKGTHNKAFRNPEKVFVIFDGFDEFGQKSNIVRERKFGNKLTDKLPFYAFYAKLALGKLLRGATIVTTSRQTALSYLKKIEFDRTVEIMGFDSNRIEKYVGHFFKDDNRRQRIWNHISTNANLLSLCYIPVNCHIVCFSFQEREEEHDLPITLTEIYKDALMLIVLNHNPEYRYKDKVSEQEDLLSYSTQYTQEVEASLHFLGELAYRGIEESRLIFEPNEVRGHEECGLLHRLEDKKHNITRTAQFCFVHLTMQEFLAARYIVATKKDNLKDLRNWVSKNIGEGKWQIVMQFLAGLLHDEYQSNESTDESSTNQIKIFTDTLPTATFEGKVTNNWPRDKMVVLILFKCIFEMSRSLKNNTKLNNFVIEKIGQVETVDFSSSHITDADMSAIVNALQELKNIRSVNMHSNHIGPLGCLEICKMLKKSERLGLDDGDAPSENGCNLAKLNLGKNEIRDDGLKYLSDALCKNECKLTTLDISDNKIGDDGLKYLSDALSKDECKLTTLNIRVNKIGDDGLKHLSDALSKNECKLTTLHISKIEISGDGLNHLFRALCTNECKLTALDIRGNAIGDDGLKHLSDALSKNECKLGTLDIRFNNISDEAIKHFQSDALFEPGSSKPYVITWPQE